MTEEQKEQIKDLRGKGEGYKKIAQYIGLSENTVKSFCWQEKAAVLLRCLSPEVVEQPSASRAEESRLSIGVPSLRQGFRGLRQQPQEILLSCVLHRRAVWQLQERPHETICGCRR